MKSLVFASILLICGCRDKATESVNPTSPLPGSYNGIFTFTQNGITTTSNVSFTFTDSSYTCVPQKMYMPPSGGGKYVIQGSKMILTDLSLHTAEFDWTLILSGGFNYSKNGNSILLTQTDDVRGRFRRIDLSKSN